MDPHGKLAGWTVSPIMIQLITIQPTTSSSKLPFRTVQQYLRTALLKLENDRFGK
ncbi:hypothetical protein WUBG_11734, partial [Wuchereria bancrofti]